MLHSKHEGHGARLHDAKPVIPVAAGCLVDDRGDVLIAQRPVGKIAAGKWEFPGGKIEPGETAQRALERELAEELGIAIQDARPLIRVRHEYSDRIVMLDTWRITRWQGALHPHEAQTLAWSKPESLTDYDLLAADQPIVDALRLPSDYVFTPPDADESRIAGALPTLPSRALLRLRLPNLGDDDYAALARRLLPRTRLAGLRLVLDRDPGDAARIGADGWHATSQRLHAPAAAPPLKLASCHDAAELDRARRLGFTAAVLGPVQRTSTHPDRAPMGWDRFGSLIDECGLPVYAIGGLGPAEREQAFACYGQGIAGISAYWR